MNFIEKVDDRYKVFFDNYGIRPSVILLGYKNIVEMKNNFNDSAVSLNTREESEVEFEVMEMRVIQVNKEHFLDVAVCSRKL